MSKWLTSKWLVRGLVLAALMVMIRLIQGVLINAFEAWAGPINWSLMLLFAIAVFIWGLYDGHADAQSNRIPDHREDLTMTWLGSGLAAGVLSGFVSWVIAWFVKSMYVSSLLNEVTSFAAFTALLTFVVGVIGVALGRRRSDQAYAKLPPDQQDSTEQGHEQPTTDVFAAVGAPATVAAAEAATATETVVQLGADTASTAGFTTEEFPAVGAEDSPATTEIPVITDGGEPPTQSNDSAK